MKHSNLKLLLLVALPGLAFADYPNLYLNFCNHTTQPIEIPTGSFWAPGSGNWWHTYWSSSAGTINEENQDIHFTMNPAINSNTPSCNTVVKMTHTGDRGGNNYFSINNNKYYFQLGTTYISAAFTCNVSFASDGHTGQKSADVDPPHSSWTECVHSVDFY